MSRINKYTCAGPGQASIKQDIQEHKLNRVVVSACSPRMHERTWRALLADSGLNPYLLEVANIREHVSWAHPANALTTEKAVDLVAAAVERVAWHDPLFPQRVPVTKSALVVGGGVGGIQTALDIAQAGIHVYLVEREPSIGGHMAQLDKTFPTLDCSACILTPKMVDAGNHPNITLLSYSEVENLEGYIGNFTATVRRKARYVKEDVCTGCNDCVEVCPVRVPSEFDEGLVDRTAIYRSFAQAVPNVFAIDKRGVAPCKNACPAGIHVQGYVALIAEGRFREAFDLIRERMPFSGACGRVCHHPCETACRRGDKDSPVAIEFLKRAAADWVTAHPEVPSAPNLNPHVAGTPLEGKKVAIVGAGPAGLTVARELANEGAACDIFEALPVAGGMMAVGIPRYRLPEDILNRDIHDIVSLPGVTLHLNTPVQLNGKSGPGPNLDSLQRDYDALFIGVGTHDSMRMRIPGEELGGVLHGAEYLRQLSLAQLGAVDARTSTSIQMPHVGERVAVIGGGNVAIDSAMTARRIGAKEVTILYRRTRAEMPANEWEIEEAEEEGIQFQFLATPLKVLGKGHTLAALHCQRMRLGEPDGSGRRRPIPIEGDTFELPVDTVIMAIGQTLEAPMGDIERTRRGWIVADPVTLQTNLPGVFAGGDAVSGPASVVEAVGQAHRAAESIQRYLLGKDVALGRSAEPLDLADVEYYDPAEWDPSPRLDMPHRPVSERGQFDEVNLGFDEEQAIAEASRCLSCGVCSECMACARVCGAGAVDHTMQDERIDIDVGAIVVATGYDAWDPSPMLEYPEVYTGLEIERLSNASGPTGGEIVKRNGEKPKRVAIMHCVGSRDEHYQPYCSRICCMYSLKLAHLIEEKTHAEVFQFYMDMRAFGKGYEEFYERVQREGVVMVRGRGAQVFPGASGDGDRLIVRAEDTDLGRPINLPVDMVVLATAVVPSKGAAELAHTLHVTRDINGFFLEGHPKLRPVDSNTDGIYLAGACQAPRDIPDTVAHASAAASQALGLLSQDYVEVVPTVAEVRTLHCVGCGLCVEVCPYGAPSLVENRGRMVAEINEALCKGCGLCVAGCRGKAISLRGFTDTQILTQMEALLQLEWA
jgi:heterodisulfide reductase subunit A